MARVIAILLCLTAANGATATDALFRDAAAAQQRKDFATAVSKYEALLKIQPDILAARANLGSALAELGQYDKAVVAFQFVLVRNPEDTAVRINLAQTFIRMQRWSDAAAQLEIINPIEADNIIASRLLLNCYMQTGSNQKLLAAAQTVSRLHPDDVDFIHFNGIALLRNGIPEGAAESLEKAGALGRRPDALTLAGVTRLKLGQLAQARQDLDRAVAMNPGTPGALTMAGLARDKSGDEEGAKVLFQKALALNSDDFDASLNLGAVLYREKNLSAARTSIANALRIQPTSAMAQYAMALIRAAVGESAASIADLERIVRLNPNWVEPRIKLASLYFRQQQKEEGLRQQTIVDQLIAQGRDQHAAFE